MKLNYHIAQQFISASRLQSYEAVCGGNQDKAFKLYNTNLRISQAFYPLLSLIEVILRNALNNELTTHFNDNDWLRNQRSGFMNDPSLTYFDRRTNSNRQNDYLKKCVNSAIADCQGGVTQGKIIANLTFGFWTALFDTTHYRILVGQPIQIFSKLPVNSTRNTVHQKFKKVNDFRNRVYHNEAIVFAKDTAGNTVFSLDDAKEIYQDIQDLFLWLDLDFTQWTKSINNINLEIERAECMMRVYPSNKYYFYRISIGVKHYRNKYSRS